MPATAPRARHTVRCFCGLLVPETDFVAKDGHVSVPQGPGLGVTIDEAALKKHTLLCERVEE
jgi:L-alanine-DL-glutamate epimerase-like enolase superfamily enzyme